MTNNIDLIKTKKDLLRSILIDIIVGVFIVAGLWTISNGFLNIYSNLYQTLSMPQPSTLGNTLFWYIEGAFFIFMAYETRKYRKIKLG